VAPFFLAWSPCLFPVGRTTHVIGPRPWILLLTVYASSFCFVRADGMGAEKTPPFCNFPRFFSGSASRRRHMLPKPCGLLQPSGPDAPSCGGETEFCPKRAKPAQVQFSLPPRPPPRLHSQLILEDLYPSEYCCTRYHGLRLLFFLLALATWHIASEFPFG